MTITRAIDPVTDNEVVIITGVVERIIIKEAERTSKNLEYGVTHIASLSIAGKWINYISLGIKEGREPNIAINQGSKDSPKWVQIQETDEVKVIVTEKVVGEKTYYSAKRTSIKLVKKNATPGQQPQQSSSANGSAYQAKEFDATGVETGHALNGAMNFIMTFGGDNSNENIVAVGKQVHNVTLRVKEKYTEQNPTMSKKDVGAASGHAVLNACKLVGVDGDFEEGVYALAMDFLNNVVPKIMEHVKGGEKPPAPAVKTTRAPAKKPATTKAKPVVEEEVFPELDEEDDSSLPF